MHRRAGTNCCTSSWQLWQRAADPAAPRPMLQHSDPLAWHPPIMETSDSPPQPSPGSTGPRHLQQQPFQLVCCACTHGPLNQAFPP